MIERIKFIMHEEGLSPSQLADKMQLQRSSLSHILSGRNNPSLDFVKKLLTTFPDYESDWLLFGENKVTKVNKNEKIKDAYLFTNVNNENAPLKKSHSSLFSKDQMYFKKNKNVKKELVRIIMVYSDGTFNELYPE